MNAENGVFATPSPDPFPSELGKGSVRREADFRKTVINPSPIGTPAIELLPVQTTMHPAEFSPPPEVGVYATLTRREGGRGVGLAARNRNESVGARRWLARKMQISKQGRHYGS